MLLYNNNTSENLVIDNKISGDYFLKKVNKTKRIVASLILTVFVGGGVATSANVSANTTATSGIKTESVTKKVNTKTNSSEKKKDFNKSSKKHLVQKKKKKYPAPKYPKLPDTSKARKYHHF